MARPLILNGFMATGKTTVGRLVAARTGAPFVDLDARIEERMGRTVAEIFKTEGEAEFRKMEAKILTELLDSDVPAVIAVGGGALLRRDLRLRAIERGVVVSLGASLKTLLSRAASDGPVRPLLTDPAQAELLLQLRAPAYAEAHEAFDVDALAPEEAAARVAEIWRREPVGVAAGPKSYSVEVGSEFVLPRLTQALSGASSALLITDDNVDALYGDAFRAAMEAAGHEPYTFKLTPGEKYKNFQSLTQICEHALACGMDRGSVFVGLGGGVVTDLAGFAAASWMRGVRWVSVPTTLLGMVDASVGGKTAIDLPGAKNCVGAFWQPSRVLCDVRHLKSEPERGLCGALAEVVKTALIGDAAMFELLERDAARVRSRDWDLISQLVKRCIAVKAAVVSRDEREGGLRAALNLGHTIGHALEAHAGFGTLTHGEAVSLGLVAALRLGVHLGQTPRELADRVETLLSRLGLPTDLASQPLAEAAALLLNDKKRNGADVRFVLTDAPGNVFFRSVQLSELQRLMPTLGRE